MKARQLTSALSVGIVAFGIQSTIPQLVVAKELSLIRSTLENTGSVGSAQGSLKSKIQAVRSQMLLKLSGLPAASYVVEVGGIPAAQFSPSVAGGAVLRFRTPAENANDIPLDFDPRGQVLAVRDAAAAVLQVTVSGSGEPADARVDERTSLASTTLAPLGKAQARFRLKDGRSTFKVEIENVPDGSYQLFVDGQLRATITVLAGQGEIEFDSTPSPPKLLLDFDPRGVMIDVTQGSDVFFTGPMAAQAAGVTTCTFARTEVAVASTGVDPDGTAKARFRIREDCDRDFRVEIEDVPVGTYSLLVAGVVRGTFDVVDTGLGIEGDIEFDTDPDDPGELLLDFDPDGQLLEMRLGSTIYFSGTFQAGPGGSGTCTPEEIDVPIASTGADPDADASARLRVRDDCEQDFTVEVEDVPVGLYDLRVGGIVRGTIAVAAVVGGTQGEIEFDTDEDEPGALPLDFDPRGALIEIAQGTNVFFSELFAGGTGGPGICTPSETEVPLLNNGPDADAKGKARWRLRDDCQRDLRVEIEGLPAGAYMVRVGGIARGTITVVTGPENEGQLQFDTDPDEPGELLLDFDPLGALIEVEQGGTVYLSRTFPAA